MSFLARSQNTMFWRGVSHPSANEILRVFVNNPCCFVLSHTREVTGWCLFRFAAVSSILLGLWSTVRPQVSWESILDMGGFSLKLIEVCQSLKLKTDSQVFVVRKFRGKRTGFSLSHWSTAGHRRLPIVGFACTGCTANCVLNNLCWQQISVVVTIRGSRTINV